MATQLFPGSLETTWLPAASSNKEALSDPRGWYRRAMTAEAGGTRVGVAQLAARNLSVDERRQARAFTRHTLEPGLTRMRPLALPANSYTCAWPTWSTFVKGDHRVVAHAGIVYRVIQIGEQRVPVGGIAGVMTLPEWRDRGYARAILANATAFVGRQLWAPFAVVICPQEATAFYEHLGWRRADADIWCDQPGGRVKLDHEVVLYAPCQAETEWPAGQIDLLGAPW